MVSVAAALVMACSLSAGSQCVQYPNRVLHALVDAATLCVRRQFDDPRNYTVHKTSILFRRLGTIESIDVRVDQAGSADATVRAVLVAPEFGPAGRARCVVAEVRRIRGRTGANPRFRRSPHLVLAVSATERSISGCP